MSDSFIDKLLEGVSSSTFLALTFSIALVCGGIYAHKLYVWVKDARKDLGNLPCSQHQETITKIERECAKKTELPCPHHTDAIHEQDKTINGISVELQYLRKNVENNEFLLSKMREAIFTQSHSPLRITDRGKQMIERLNLMSDFNANWQKIKEIINNGVENKNAYDINEFCLQQAVVFPEKFLSEEMVGTLKRDAYNEGLLLIDYMKVVAVLARDRYFQEENINTD